MKRIIVRSSLLALSIPFLLGGYVVTRAAPVEQQVVYTVYLPFVANKLPYCGPAPYLISPSNNAQTGTLIPLFQWNAGNNSAATALRLEVSDNPSFSSLVSLLTYGVGQGAGEFQFLDNFAPGTTYYWRIALICNSLQSPYSPAWSFVTGSGGTILPAPTLTAPANGSQVQPPMILTWASVAGASGYLVRWGPALGTSFSYRLVTDPQYAILFLSPDTTYEWSIKARNSYAYGDESEKWQFTTGPASQAMFSSLGAGQGIAVEINGQAATWEK